MQDIVIFSQTFLHLILFMELRIAIVRGTHSAPITPNNLIKENLKLGCTFQTLVKAQHQSQA